MKVCFILAKVHFEFSSVSYFYKIHPVTFSAALQLKAGRRTPTPEVKPARTAKHRIHCVPYCHIPREYQLTHQNVRRPGERYILNEYKDRLTRYRYFIYKYSD